MQAISAHVIGALDERVMDATHELAIETRAGLRKAITEAKIKGRLSNFFVCKGSIMMTLEGDEMFAVVQKYFQGVEGASVERLSPARATQLKSQLQVVEK